MGCSEAAKPKQFLARSDVGAPAGFGGAATGFVSPLGGTLYPHGSDLLAPQPASCQTAKHSYLYYIGPQILS